MSEEEPNPKQKTLESVPDNWRDTLLEEGAKAGAHRSDDALWPIVGMMVNAWAASDAARASADKSAETLRQIKDSIDDLKTSLNDVPTQASKAVLGAGKTAAQEAESSIQGTTNSQIERINESISTTVKDKLESGGNDLIKQIGDAFAQGKADIDQHKQDQVKQFKGNLQDAATSVAASEITKARRQSFLSGVGAVLLGVVITIGGSYGWLNYGPGWFQSQSSQTVLKDCGPGHNGGTWCRIKPPH